MDQPRLEAIVTRLPRVVLLTLTAWAVVLLAPDLMAIRVARGSQSSTTAKTGAIEGEITVRAEAASKTADRYVASTGESRAIPRIPVIVKIEGTVQAAPQATASGPQQLLQRGEMFSPLMLVVPVGATVAFPNGDPLFHNVFSYSRAKRFDLGRYKRGEAKTVVFDRAGYIKVMCEVHKWMRAGIVVVENPYYAIVPENGRYRIDGIPPGRYRIAIEQFDKGSHTRELDVTAGGTVRLDVTL